MTGLYEKFTGPKTCSVPFCEAKHYAFTYCRKHHGRFKKHGDPRKSLRGANLLPCGSIDCDRTQVAKGYCYKHYCSIVKPTYTQAAA